MTPLVLYERCRIYLVVIVTSGFAYVLVDNLAAVKCPSWT